MNNSILDAKMALMLLCLNSYNTSSDRQKQKKSNNKPRERSDYYDHQMHALHIIYSILHVDIYSNGFRFTRFVQRYSLAFIKKENCIECFCCHFLLFPKQSQPKPNALLTVHYNAIQFHHHHRANVRGQTRSLRMLTKCVCSMH